MTAVQYRRVLATGLGSPRNGLPMSPGYVYRGTRFDAAPVTPIAPASGSRRPRGRTDLWHRGDPIAHGTSRGYQQELRSGLDRCPACRAAHTAAAKASKLRRRRRAAA